MTDDDLPPAPQRPTAPPLVWMLLAALLILAVVGLMFLLHPPGAGVGRSVPDIVPAHPKAASVP